MDFRGILLETSHEFMAHMNFFTYKTENISHVWNVVSVAVLSNDMLFIQKV